MFYLLLSQNLNMLCHIDNQYVTKIKAFRDSNTDFLSDLYNFSVFINFRYMLMQVSRKLNIVINDRIQLLGKEVFT